MANDAKTVKGHRPGEPVASPAGPPELPEAATSGSVKATHVGDARHDHAGNVLVPPAIPPSRYILGAEIARGGMGRVVEATDTLLGRVVALKEALSTEPEALERFARETRITARLEHPSIVPVHDGGTSPSGTPFYVMRKIEGRPLERLVEQSKDLPERLRLIRHMVAATEAIAHAHERGIVHRDIKPSNILVGELGETIVIDWGLAKVIGEADDSHVGSHLGVPLAPTAEGAPGRELKTRAGVVFGTPGFMAPEQLRGGPVDPRWDVYALGATLYHLLSKKPPHHAASADDMMKAAVTAPPTPIAQLVAGVPPELATIVDKALAFDPEQRYQDARELAADLQRFLGGQLVASHHYTPGERISRYVAQHRYAFIVGAIAAVALMIGGALAFVRIVNERNRADHNAIEARKAQQTAEDEKRLAERRTEDLSLSSARSMASTNPTFAIALVKPLVDKRWREVRAIAAEARAAGVAWSLPASPSTQSVQLSRDGRRALVAGSDGVVRLYELEARTQVTIAETGAPVSAVFAADDKRAVLWAGTRITVLELGGAAKREITAPREISSLVVLDTTAYWIDRTGALWQMELAAVAPLQLPLDEAVTRLAASPDGRWLALAGSGHLWLFDRTQPTAPAIAIVDGTVHALAWAADSARLVALRGDSAIDIAMAPTPTARPPILVGERTQVLATTGPSIGFTLGPTGVASLLNAESSRTRPVALPGALGLEEATRGIVVASAEDRLVLLTDHGEHALASPAGHVTQVRASREAPYVVAIADDRLVVWNLDDIVPRAVGTQIATAKFVTGDDLVATTLAGPAQWIDLQTGRARELGRWPAILDVTASPSGRFAVAIDMAHVAHLLAAGVPPVTIPGTVDRAGFVDDARILLATDDGALFLYDVPSATRTHVRDASGAALTGLAWTGEGVVAALLADHTLWREVLATRATATARVPGTPTSNPRVTSDRDVFVAIGAELWRWPATGTELVRHATLPVAITSLRAIGADHLLATSERGAAYVVSTDTPDVRDLRETLAPTTSVSAAGLVAVLDRGAIDILDPLIEPPRWRLASAATYADAQIASDGRRVLAKTGGTLVVWDLALPVNAAETAAWLDRMTNAVTGSGAKTLGWR